MLFDPTGKDDFLMTNSQDIYRYLHGGQGEVTLVNPATLKGHQYAFLAPKNARDFPEDTIFVYGIHEGHKMYLGMLSGSDFRRTAKSAFLEDTEIVKGARYIVKMANRQDLVNKKLMLLYHCGKCCVCGRKLRSNRTITEGIGRNCKRVYNAKLEKVPWDGN